MTLLSRESAMAPGGQRLAASVSGVSLAVLGGKGRGEGPSGMVNVKL